MGAIKIVGFSGSLRKGSFARMLLHAAAKRVPSDAEFEVLDISQIPLFDQDNEMNPTPAVVTFKQKIEAADALVIVTPEYNFSFSGVLKNAIDNATRPYGKNSFKGKPAVIMSSSPGQFGGTRAWYHLHQVAIAMGIVTQDTPQVSVPEVDKKFDEQGNLVDQPTGVRIDQSLAGLVALVRQLKK